MESISKVVTGLNKWVNTSEEQRQQLRQERPEGHATYDMLDEMAAQHPLLCRLLRCQHAKAAQGVIHASTTPTTSLSSSTIPSVVPRWIYLCGKLLSNRSTRHDSRSRSSIGVTHPRSTSAEDEQEGTAPSAALPPSLERVLLLDSPPPPLPPGTSTSGAAASPLEDRLKGAAVDVFLFFKWRHDVHLAQATQSSTMNPNVTSTSLSLPCHRRNRFIVAASHHDAAVPRISTDVMSFIVRSMKNTLHRHDYVKRFSNDRKEEDSSGGERSQKSRVESTASSASSSSWIDKHLKGLCCDMPLHAMVKDQMMMATYHRMSRKRSRNERADPKSYVVEGGAVTDPLVLRMTTADLSSFA